MKKYGIFIFKLVTVWVLILFFYCCAGDSPSNTNNNNNNNQNSDFFPLAVGSWWKYKVSFDPTSEQFSIDSTVLDSRNLVNGKDAYIFVTFIKNKTTGEIELQDTSYYYKEGPKIFKFMYNPFTNQKEWLLFADIQLEYIKIAEYPMTMEMEEEAFFNGKQKIERVTEGPEKFYLGNNAINCIKSKVIVTLEGELTKKDGSKSPYLEIIQTEYQWFGYNIGMVRLFWPNNEYDRTLIDYNIVQE